MMKPNVDYSVLAVETIKTQLASRGIETMGTRPELVERLKKAVDDAWAQFNAKNPPQLPLFPQTKKAKNKKAKKSPEEIAKEQEMLAQKRQEKLKRKLEHEKRVDEARQRKRLKKEERAKKQSEQIARQKLDKEQRQMCEAFLGFDVRRFEEQVRKKLDPTGGKIVSCSYDTVSKRFRVKFVSSEEASKLTQGITMTKPKSLTFDSDVSILPSPVESRCVMFLYPLSPLHPDKEQAEEWCQSKGMTDSKDSQILAAWIQAALEEFSKHGTVVNIYRERGFMVVNFTTKTAAQKMLKNAKTFNGCGFIHFQTGTPTKLDKRIVDKEHGPKGKVPKKTNGKVGTVKHEN